jgi:hypothetical protein
VHRARLTRTNALLFSIEEGRGVLPLQIPLLGTGLLDLAEELDPERDSALSLGFAHVVLCLVIDFDLATACSPSPPTGFVLPTSLKCSHGHVHDEFDQYHLVHELYDHPCEAELKKMLQYMWSRAPRSTSSSHRRRYLAPCACK